MNGGAILGHHPDRPKTNHALTFKLDLTCGAAQLCDKKTPTLPGGGTVEFVSPRDQVCSADLGHREEGGTPTVIGGIRAALALLIKEAMGAKWSQQRQAEMRQRARSVWLNFSASMTDAKATKFIASVDERARSAPRHLPAYVADAETARFSAETAAH